MPLRGPDESLVAGGARNAPRRPAAPVAAAAFLAAAGALGGAGCIAYERVQIEVPRRTDAERGPEGALLIGGPAEASGGRDLGASLAASGGASRAALGLVSSALDLIGACARARSVVDGLAHFGVNGGPSVIVRLGRSDGRAGETWFIDRSWALRRMECGAVLVWEGDLSPVLERLSLIFPACRLR